MATDIRAELRFVGVSAQKVRLVLDMVRGKPANQALDTLKFVNKVAAHHVRKVLASAVANAEENFGVIRDERFSQHSVLGHRDHLRESQV